MSDPTNRPEGPALSQAVAQSWRLFLETFEPLRPTLYRYCRCLTRSPWDAEDLVQDTLARAFATLAGLYESPPEPRAWLFRVASNLWIDQVRRRGVRMAALDVEAPAHPADVAMRSALALPTTLDATRAPREAAGTLLSQLSPQERAAFVLKDVFSLELEEIASILSTSVGAVKAALHRGRGKLAEPDMANTRLPAPGVLDAFCAAFNARDLERLTALLLDTATVEVVGASTIYGAKRAGETVLPGMLFGSKHMAAPADGGTCDGIDPRFTQAVLALPARLTLQAHRGEHLLLSWYAHHDGEFVRAITRVELSADGDRISWLRNYFYTPEIIAEVCAELGLPSRSNGTFRARGEA